jgi:S-formylglutathione hydrolase
MMRLERLATAKCFGGTQATYIHWSEQTATAMKFAVYLPPQAEKGRVPVLYFLSGLTCTEENFSTKAGVQRWAAREGIAIVVPDTSPRGANLPGEADHWDFGLGAGFYVDATEEPWRRHYRMYSYVTRELPALVQAHFPVEPQRESLSGHSMGGHGALVAALREKGRYRSVSAFSPIASASRCPWGEKALGKFLGADRRRWEQYDASLLVRNADRTLELFVDQGTDDQFLAEQLKPELLEEACREVGHPLRLRRHPGYDHSYWFIQTFLEEHVVWHAERLRR